MGGVALADPGPFGEAKRRPHHRCEALDIGAARLERAHLMLLAPIGCPGPA
jgi:hypothetical protein